MILRPYQKEAIDAVETGWAEHNRHLLVLPTGTGKTVVFSHIAQDRTANGRVLILAHRDELIEQARDKYTKCTGMMTAKEKAGETCIGSDLPVVVGSVQTLMSERRLQKFEHDHFQTMIIDEAHHALSDSYRRIIDYFPTKLLGVTATPDRGDKKNLGQIFDNIAYEYSMRDAVRDGYLCDIHAQTVPLEIDLSETKVRVGDFEVNSIAETLEPYLPKIAESIAEYAADRKTVVFLPLISIAQEFTHILRECGLDAKEVNGMSPDRKETLEWFDKAGPGAVLCNAMLLTEGWDCPSVDCVVVLRPTKIRSLYVQMVGRGTRPAPGKRDLLILDFLWMCQKHDLCRPSYLSAEDPEDRKVVTAKSIDEEIDLFGAASDAVEARRRKLAEELAQNRQKKAKLIDPLQFFVAIGDMGLADYEPSFRWEAERATQKQIDMIRRNGIAVSDDLTKGAASMIIDRIITRRNQKLATIKQVMALERQGYENVGTWTFEQASRKISQLAAVGWHRWKLHD